MACAKLDKFIHQQCNMCAVLQDWTTDLGASNIAHPTHK